ncbi:amino acid ABC transporter substrate-binding protein [Belnapia rosea]|uniref:Amino acid ABC transporter substrate-binding protein, PAAT family n=1 Tax=Belnapia rosea TaxID=938405 RepID=A0A1G6R2T3_9PROT|nr:amino acid ABC transporter substrate-binding protein [Belnapia rosea]SDB73240.1 amino acid ABC transporter substrate-binding protein, PAAT family [Belnapia rosea]SDC98365.1 amino acid ABC transporter substrate-binding protein, PAAT family [Belnapia rosea]
MRCNLAGWTRLFTPMALLLGVAGAAQAGPTLDAVRRNGEVRCAVSTGLAGMSQPDANGVWQGFDADICRAVATAVFGDAGRARFVPTTTATRFTALQSGEVDLLSRTTALTLARDSQLGLTISVAHFFTGQGILVHKRLNITRAEQLDGATFCATLASEIERNLADWARQKNIRITTIPFDTPPTILAAFQAGRCDAISNDMINLSGNRTASPNPADLVLLPELVFKEPHGVLVRNGDPEWAALTRWAVFALIQAEEMGLTRANVAQVRETTQDPKIRRFLGLTENVGTGWGLPAGWAFEVVRQVGNYGEVFERGPGRVLGMERGLNRPWTEGGMLMSWLWQ